MLRKPSFLRASFCDIIDSPHCFFNISWFVKIPLPGFKISSISLISRTYKKEIVVFWELIWLQELAIWKICIMYLFWLEFREFGQKIAKLSNLMKFRLWKNQHGTECMIHLKQSLILILGIPVAPEGRHRCEIFGFFLLSFPQNERKIY